MRRADAALNADVRRGLERDPTLSGIDLEVWSMDGLVGLAGTVGRPADVWKAMWIASRIDAVKGVVSYLSVADPAERRRVEGPRP